MANYNHHNKQQNHSDAHKEPPIKKFMLGTKEFDDKNAEFEYDKGQYIITEIVGEERTELYRSRNMQEAYMKWNVYIGRKKERPSRRKEDNQQVDGSSNTPVSSSQSTSESTVEEKESRSEDNRSNYRDKNSHRKKNNYNKNHHSRNQKGRPPKRQSNRVPLDYEEE